MSKKDREALEAIPEDEYIKEQIKYYKKQAKIWKKRLSRVKQGI